MFDDYSVMVSIALNIVQYNFRIGVYSIVVRPELQKNNNTLIIHLYYT